MPPEDWGNKINIQVWRKHRITSHTWFGAELRASLFTFFESDSVHIPSVLCADI